MQPSFSWCENQPSAVTRTTAVLFLAHELISQKVFAMLLCKRPFPHKSVNVLFILVMIMDKLRDVCGN